MIETNINRLERTAGSTAASLVANSLAALQKKDWFRTVSKKLSLIPKSEVSYHAPTDMSYVFGGAYTPLTCRFVMHTYEFIKNI